MAEIIQINSKRGLVKFSFEDLIDLNLDRYIRSSFKGIGKRGLLLDTPFQDAAAKAYQEKYPQAQIHIAEKCILNHENGVEVVLKTSKVVSDEMYNQHSNSIVLKKQVKTRG
jgi:hypothetical protein